MRAFLVAALLLSAAVSVLPTASAVIPPCESGTGNGTVCVLENQGFGQCVVAVHTTFTEQCVVYGEGVFESSGYYLVFCPLKGDVNLCVTDSSEDPVCVRGERLPVCVPGVS